MMRKTVSLRLKTTMCLLAALVAAMLLAGCARSVEEADLVGVFVCPKCDTPAVTFELPAGKTIEQVVGSSVPEDHVTHVAEKDTEPFDVHWSPVESGGFVSWVGRVCRYAPGAEANADTGEPPGYVMIYDPVDSLELLDPTDVDVLQQRYGITLNL